MSETLPAHEAESRFEALRRRASRGRERITITEPGEPSAVLLSAEDLEELEIKLALAEFDARRARGEAGPTVPHDEVKRRLGLA